MNVTPPGAMLITGITLLLVGLLGGMAASDAYSVEGQRAAVVVVVLGTLAIIASAWMAALS